MPYKYNPFTDKLDYYEPAQGTPILSIPGETDYRIKALRLDADGKVVVTYDENPGGTAGYISSSPGSGEYLIKALRLDSDLKIVFTYDGDAEP